MKSKLFTLGLTTAAVMSAALLPTTAIATPVMLSTVNGINLPDANEVTGLRVSLLHGKTSQVTGLDLSILGLSETNKTTGLNFGWLLGASKVNQEMNGISFGIVNWSGGITNGLNLGLVNVTNNVKGLNWSAINYSEGYTVADVGFASISNKSNFQLGLVNITKQIDGVQIGLINCADNGFFKCFPIFNFAK